MGSITPSSHRACPPSYVPSKEASNILTTHLASDLSRLNIPIDLVKKHLDAVSFTSTTEQVYFPIAFKETETLAALKALEGSVAAAIADVRFGAKSDGSGRQVHISLEKATAFAFQAYVATIGGLGKLDPGVKALLKNTDLLSAQADPYRRMSANLYETKSQGKYYHIHGSLEASTTLAMIGLEPFRPDLDGDYESIIKTIETKVKGFTVEELEKMNAEKRQAGVPVLKHEEFLKTPHGQTNKEEPAWTVEQLESDTPPAQFPAPKVGGSAGGKVLNGIKVLEMCRIIAGPTITRILGEYGADVLKITSPNLSDVPFFQVDGNMGKHAADLDLKTDEGRAKFEELLQEVDVFVDGYRPGALAKLGYGPERLTELAKKRGKGIVYVNENCFGYKGEWAGRPGWQQIADCVTGLAWTQGTWMHPDSPTPVIPPFPISDYGTGCMGAIAALTGLLHRATNGGSYHGRASLMQYDLLLFRIGTYDQATLDSIHKLWSSEWPAFFDLRHHDSVDRIGGTALRGMQKLWPHLFDGEAQAGQKKIELLDRWIAQKYGGKEVCAIRPVVEIEGVVTGFERSSRPNGSDEATWDFSGDTDVRLGP